ncbi:MAG: methyl-accepting chemotaxis protein [Anaerovoracaceae bacterium]
MKWFNDMKIGVRILMGFLIVVIIAGAIGGVGIYNLQRVNNSYKVAYKDSVDVIGLLEDISSSFQRNRMNLYGFVLADSSEDKRFHQERIENFDKIVKEGIATYQNILSVYDSHEIKDILNHLDRLVVGMDEYISQRDKLISSMGMDPSQKMNAYHDLKDGVVRAAALDVDEAIESIITYEKEFAYSEIDNNISSSNMAVIFMVIILLAGIILAVTIGIYISRSISVKLTQLVEVSDRIAAGDLSAEADADTKDEIGILAQRFRNMTDTLKAIINDLSEGLDAMSNGDFTVSSKVQDLYVGDYMPIMEAMYKMITRISDTIGQINITAEQVSTGSDQVSSGAQALAAGSTEQAASVEELAASVEAIAKQAEENAAAIVEASKSIDKAGTDVNAGNEHMEQLAQAMTDISSASNQIANITKVIEDIAFQTNILALNAAIEAARAGNAGKGFAVVADEVRSLAVKSAEAARETGVLIQSSVTAVERGSEITGQTAQILSEVGISAGEVTGSFEIIEKSIAEQTTAIEQIKDGLSQISSVVQTNAATAEENSATSEEMSSQAATLRMEIEKFKILGGTSTPVFEQKNITLGEEDHRISLSDSQLDLGKY